MKKLMTILASCLIATSVLASEVELKTVKVSHDVQTLERGVDALMRIPVTLIIQSDIMRIQTGIAAQH